MSCSVGRMRLQGICSNASFLPNGLLDKLRQVPADSESKSAADAITASFVGEDGGEETPLPTQFLQRLCSSEQRFSGDSKLLYGAVFFFSHSLATVVICEFHSTLTETNWHPKCDEGRRCELARSTVQEIQGCRAIALRSSVVYVSSHGCFMVTAEGEFIHRNEQNSLQKRVKSVYPLMNYRSVIYHHLYQPPPISALVLEWEDRTCSLDLSLLSTKREDQRREMVYLTSTVFGPQTVTAFEQHIAALNKADASVDRQDDTPFRCSQESHGWSIRGSLEFANDGSDIRELTATCPLGSICFLSPWIIQNPLLEHSPVLPRDGVPGVLWASNFATLMRFDHIWKLSVMWFR